MECAGVKSEEVRSNIQMEFYESIADLYDRIFPLDRETLSLVKSYLKKPGERVIDIGCATGIWL